MQSDLQGYLKAFQNLRTDKNRNNWADTLNHRAPYKPLLVLSVLDLIEEGQIKANLIKLTPDLIETFGKYWSRVIPPGRLNTIALPFFHMRSEGYWHLIPKEENTGTISNFSQIKSLNKLREIYLGAKLNEELYQLLQVADTRKRIREVILGTYFFENQRKKLLDQSKVNIKSHRYSENLLDRARQFSLEQAAEFQNEPHPIRYPGFRRAVVVAYDHRCAFCGIRVVTWEAHTAVEAAHIKPWRESHNDDPRNGIALCKLCHWTFDEGLMGIDNSYRILVSSLLQDNRNLPGHLSTMVEHEIGGPKENKLWPDKDCIKWHRDKIFQPY